VGPPSTSDERRYRARAAVDVFRRGLIRDHRARCRLRASHRCGDSVTVGAFPLVETSGSRIAVARRSPRAAHHEKDERENGSGENGSQADCFMKLPSLLLVNAGHRMRFTLVSAESSRPPRVTLRRTMSFRRSSSASANAGRRRSSYSLDSSERRQPRLGRSECGRATPR